MYQEFPAGYHPEQQGKHCVNSYQNLNPVLRDCTVETSPLKKFWLMLVAYKRLWK